MTSEAIQQRARAIERDRREHEEFVLLLLLLFLRSAEEHALSAVAIGSDPVRAAQNVIIGNPVIYQPGITPVLAWAMTAAVASGHLRAVADYSASVLGKPIPIDRLRRRIIRAGNPDKLPGLVLAAMGGADVVRSRHLQNTAQAQRQSESLIPRLAERIRAAQDETPQGDAVKSPGGTTHQNGVHVPMAIAGIQDRVAEAFAKSGLSTGRETAFTIKAIVEADVVQNYEMGRWEGWQTPAVHKALWGFHYSAILDGKTSRMCRTLDGMVAPKEDPVWRRFTPPNHFHCRSCLIEVWGSDLLLNEPVVIQPSASVEELMKFASDKAKFQSYL